VNTPSTSLMPNADTSVHQASVDRPRALPLTGAMVFLFVSAMVLLSQSTATLVISTGIGLGLVFVFAVEASGPAGSFCFPAPLVWFAVYVAFSILQMIWAPGSLTMLGTLVQLLVMATILVNYIAQSARASAVEWALYFSVGCTFVYNVVGDPHVIDGRFGSLLLNANAYALLLMYGALFAARRLLVTSVEGSLRPKTALALALYSGLSLYGIIVLTASRKGMLLTLASGVVLTVYWVWHQSFSRRVLLSGVCIAVGVALAYLLYRSPQFSRIVDLSHYLGGGNVADTGLVKRNALLHDALDLWLQRPFRGWGLDQFRTVSGWSTYAHDNYVEILANQGLFGLLAYVMVYVSVLVSLVRSLVRSRDRVLRVEVWWGLTVLGVQIAWDVAAVSYYSKLNWVVMSVLVGLAARAAARTSPASAARTPGSTW
jgi:O-antigen ligase